MKFKRSIPVILLPALFVTTMTSSTTLWSAGQHGAPLSNANARSLVAQTRSEADGSRTSRSATSLPTTTFETTTTMAPPTLPEVVAAEVTAAAASVVPPAPAQAPSPAQSLPANDATPSTTKAPTRQAVTTPPTTAAPTTQPRAASVPSSIVDDYLLQAINDERSARGLAPLQLDATLSKMAKNWSAEMGANGAMSHSGSGIPAGFNAFGENVLKATSGTNAGAMHNLWMGSSGHRKQMLQPGFDRVGIGAVCVNGSVYATEMFGHTSAAGQANLSDEIPDAKAQAPVSGGPTC